MSCREHPRPGHKLPFEMHPLDDLARDGTSWLVSDGVEFAVARWTEAGWVYPAASGMPLQFIPVGYSR